MYGGDVGPGRNERRPGELYRSDQGTPSALGLVRILHGKRRSLNSGGGGRHQICQFPVDDVPLARITQGVGGCGMTFGEDKKRGQLEFLVGTALVLFVCWIEPLLACSDHCRAMG